MASNPTTEFKDAQDYVAARRAFIRELVRFSPRVSDQECVNEAVAMSIAFLTICERSRI